MQKIADNTSVFDEATQRLITSPVAGCYMTGIGDAVKNQAIHIFYRQTKTSSSG